MGTLDLLGGFGYIGDIEWYLYIIYLSLYEGGIYLFIMILYERCIFYL